jgi:uncharacterized protein (DUF362 family)
MSLFNRRDFIKKSMFAGAGLAALPELMKADFNLTNNIDISVVNGQNFFENVLKSVEKLGGISKFVPSGSKVGLLVNGPAQWTRPGTYTNTDITLAILKLLNDAGAKEIVFLREPANDYFKRSMRSVQFEKLVQSVRKNSGEFKEVEITKGIALKKANIIKDLFDCDIFINVPITKHHSLPWITNCLKNYMGNCSRATNLSFHNGPNKTEESEDAEFLSQCVADVNLVRKPDLCVCDATEVLKTNGPFGPGEIIKPLKIYSGTDPVALDAYGSTLLDFRPEDVRSVVLAHNHGIGKMDIKNMIISEI